jgi:hypothetical protein
MLIYVSSVPSGQKRGQNFTPFPVNSPYGASDSDSAPSLAKCANGTYDTAFHNLAVNLVAGNQPNAIIRPGREFNGAWYTWHVHPDNVDDPDSGNGTFIQCWKRLVEDMRAVSVNFEFMWSPVMGFDNTDPRTGKPWDQKRGWVDGLDSHGKPYIDYVGPDGYDGGYTTNGANDWTTGKVDPHHVPSTMAAKGQQKWTIKLTEMRKWHDFATKPSPASVTGIGVNHRVTKFAIPEWGVLVKPAASTPNPGHDPYNGGGDNSYYIEKMHDYLVDPLNDVVSSGFWEGNARGLLLPDVAPERRDPTVADHYSAWQWMPNSRTSFQRLFGAPPASTNGCGSASSSAYSVATQTIRTTAAGTYKVWARMKRDSTTPTNDSFLLQVDDQGGAGCLDVGDGGITTNAWTWVNWSGGNTAATMSLNLSAGMHTIKLIGNEPGVTLDRVLLLPKNCNPRSSSDGKGGNCVAVPSATTDPAGTDTTRQP